jgi:hypothetical protein
LRRQFGMLRGPQHERKIVKEAGSPFVLSPVEGFPKSFSAAFPKLRTLAAVSHWR